MDADPSMDAISGPYATAFNHYVRHELGYENDLPYEQISRRVQPWSFKDFEGRPIDVTPLLERAMRTNPHLKVHVAYGYFDGATPHHAAEDVIAHLRLPDELRANIEHAYYEAGHMMYVHEPTRLQAEQGPRRLRDPSGRLMRSLAALVLLLLGGLLVPTATAGWWLRDTVVPRTSYVETVAPLAGNEDVQEAVRRKLVRETTESLGTLPAAVADQVETLVRRATRVVVEGPAFEEAWRESNRAAHRQIVGAMTGKSDSVGVDGGTVELRLGPLVAAVREEVDKAGIPLSGAIPQTDTTYPIGTTAELGRAQTAFRLFEDYGRALPVLAAVLILVGLALARRRGPALAGTALVALVGLGLLWLGLGVGRSAYLDALPAAVPEAAGRAYYDILTADLRSLVLVVAAGSGVALVLGLLGGTVGGRRS